MDDKIYKRSELKVYPILDDPKAELERVKKLNKEAYERMKFLAYFQCVGGRDGTDKWKDPE